MAVSKKRKTKSSKKRMYRTTKHMPNVKLLQFKNVACYWNEKLDLFRVFLDMYCNDTKIVMHGYIQPDTSYFEGIHILNKSPTKTTTCSELYLTRKDSEKFFTIIKGYVDTIGDLLDAGWDIDQLPKLDVSDNGRFILEKDVVTHSRLVYD